MKARFIRGTTWSGKIVNAGDTHEMEADVFRLFKLAGNAVEADVVEPVVSEPEPDPVPEPKAPTKKLRRKGK